MRTTIDKAGRVVIPVRRSTSPRSPRRSATGGRTYDARIFEVARTSGATIIVTDNRRHFITSLRHGMRVETPSEFLAAQRKGRSGG